MYKILRSLFIILFLISCKTEADPETFSTKEIISETTEVILSVENDEIISEPFRITSLADGFALYDNSLNQVQLFTINGDPVRTFGNKGRGPGEFQSVSTIKFHSGQIIVSDTEQLLQVSFDLKGNVQSMYELDSSTLFARDNGVISPTAFISPTNGEDNSLARFSDKLNNTVFTFGKPVVEKPETADFNQWQQDLSSGKVPDFFRNRVAISGGESIFYLFLQTEGVLQQYTAEGKLNWERAFSIPEFDDEFDRFVERNKNNSTGRVYMLQYVHNMEHNNEGVYLLLRIPGNYPPTILFVDHNGENVRFYRFHEMEHRPSQFSISPDKEWIYFLSTAQGVIYRSRWPD